MSKYIDAARLMAILVKRCKEADNLEAWRAYARACGDVRDLPAADVVEVVRCRECKYREDEQPSMVYCPCMVGGWVDENWFCAGGEKND